MSDMKRYKVSGTLTDTFERNYGDFTGETMAVSVAKAKSNVLYQASQKANKRGLKWYNVVVKQIAE